MTTTLPPRPAPGAARDEADAAAATTGAPAARALGVAAMVAMALSVTTIFVNSLWGRPRLFFDAILSVGRSAPAAES